jgi:hypothetical protein
MREGLSCLQFKKGGKTDIKKRARRQVGRMGGEVKRVKMGELAMTQLLFCVVFQ